MIKDVRKVVLCCTCLFVAVVPARAQQARQFVDDGVAAFERGDTSAARAAFEKAISLKADEVTAHTYLGIIADRAGDLKQAERHFAAAVKADPNSASARNNYGAILMRTGRSSLAAVEFEKSLKLNPNQPNALTNLAQIRFAGGTDADLRASSELFKRALAIEPDVEIARALTAISLRLKDHSAASTYYQKYAAALATESGAAAGASAARAELGAALFEAGLLQEAEAELSAAVSANPADTESVVRLARVYLARKDLPAAGRTLEASVARGNDPAPVYVLLAEVYEQSGHVENAIPAMRLAIQRDPKSEKNRFAYAVLLTNANAPAAAVIRLEESLKEFPSSSRLWFALGYANFKLDKNEEAERALRKAIELDPKFAPAFAYLGLIRARIGDYAEAISIYERALKADTKLAVVHHLIADAMLKQMNADARVIEKHLRQSVEMDPTFMPARLSLGKLFMRSQRWAEAASEFEQVVKLDPNVPDGYYQLGLAYGRLKRTTEAQTAMANFKRLNAAQKKRDDEELREVVKRLSNVRF
ncbi:MAG TPA: tetratricopeptide repeat protein [Pyrinomonadaceae bacterium]|nr:tetratricopeptide repeat protein [Pyrinomonadaceae bacterium]